MIGGVWLLNRSINGVHKVPDNPGVIAALVGRGWEVTDLPNDLDSDDEEFQTKLAELQAEDDKKTKTAAKSATKSKKEDE